MQTPRRALKAQITGTLRTYAKRRPLPVGIRADECRDCFVAQLVESLRRVEYIAAIQKRPVSPVRADPRRSEFDPLKAAVLRRTAGDLDEACWLVFLAIHFGRHRRDGWQLARDVYAGPTKSKVWTWKRVSRSPSSFREWLTEASREWSGDGVRRRFGNHHKYQSLDAWSENGTGAAVQSYVEWIARVGNHRVVFEQALLEDRRAPQAFDYLYTEMAAVRSFGRTMKFDYLTMVGNLKLAPIVPGSPYLVGSTGPRHGALLLFHGPGAAPPRTSELERRCVEFANEIGIGMQAMEDALCNWQKSPSRFVAFRG